MSFNIFGPVTPPESFLEDARIFRSLPQDKLKRLIELSIDVMEKDIAVTPESFKEATSISFEEGYGAYRFIVNVADFYGIHTEQEIVEDFLKLDISEDRRRILLDLLRSNRERLRGFWSRRRNEAVPTFSEMNWRVDVRVSSSDYLKGKEVVALVRLQASDNEETSQIYFELDKEHLSSLETTFNKLKEKFLEAEKAISTEQTSK